jgi:DNA-binding response OmpR family regulator
MEHGYTLLLADDHAAHRQRLADRLAADGYAVEQAATEAVAAQRLAAVRPDALIVADLPPPMTTAAFIAALRAGHVAATARQVPVIVLTSEPRDLSLLQCFNAGADDLQARWIAYPELRARIAALLSRACAREAHRRTWAVGPLAVDLDARLASWHGRTIPLTNLEFALLAKLASNPTRVQGKDELLRDVWGFQTPAKTRTVDVHARRLRTKLAAAGATGWVVTRHGLGYQLLNDDSAAVDGPLTAA